MKTHKIIVTVAMVISILSLSATAKVFWTRPAARGHAVLETSLNWKTLYAGSVRINDGKGNLTIIGCNEPLGTVMTKLRQAYASFKMLENFRQNETMGWARMRENGTIVTLLTLAPNAPEQTVLFVLTQAKDDFEKSRLPPAAPSMRDPPPYPGSHVQTHLTSAESKTQLEIYAAPAMPEAVQAYYENNLRGQAWTRLDPASASLAIYRKGSTLCAVLALPSGAGAGSTITVLHKRLNME